MDLGFIKRVYWTSVAVWLFVLMWCAALRSLPVGIGVTIGFAISLGSLVLLERLVRALFSPDGSGRSKRPVRKLAAAAVVKYAAIGVILWAALKFEWASPVGLAIGIGLPQAVIFLKALGIVLDFGPELGRRL